jgi:sugar phosphate isomerase/epimerase
MSSVLDSLGVVHIVFAPDPIGVAAQRAAALGFDHIDVVADLDVEDIALPVGDRMAVRSPQPGCSCPAPPLGYSWDRAVAAYRRCPGMRLEPWDGSICNSIERVVAMLDAVPGLRLLVDTGHVAAWGEDPCDLLAYADHVQLRQARRDVVQVHADDDGDVDFAAVLARLDAVGYAGRLSVEYFDLPEYGWPLDDPVGHAVALAAHVRALR